MFSYTILDTLEKLGIKNCRIGAYSMVPKELQQHDPEWTADYIKRELSKSIIDHISEKIEIYRSDDHIHDRYSTELFVFTKEELKKFVKEIRKTEI